MINELMFINVDIFIFYFTSNLLQGTPEGLAKLRENLKNLEQACDKDTPHNTSTPTDSKMRSRLPRRSTQKHSNLNEATLAQKK